MSGLTRLSFTIDRKLLDRLETLVEKSRYENRSEFIRDMIREKLAEEDLAGNAEGIGTVTLVYDHHARQLGDRLMKIQHGHHASILAVTHVHLDSHLCAEVIIMRGRANDIKEIADLLKQQKGVLHAGLTMAAI